MAGWLDGRMDGWKGGKTDEMNGGVGWMEGWMDVD